MSKILKFLMPTSMAICLVSSSTISCAKKNQNQDLIEGNDIINSAKLISQLILSGRHENLNYNVNEVLTDFLAPNHNWSGLGPNYNYIDEKTGKETGIDFSKEMNFYKNQLNPVLSNYDHGVLGQAAVYASYVMGMYDNNFYKSAIKNGFFNDSLSREGTVGLFDTDNYERDEGEKDPNLFRYNNSKGVLNGLLKDLKLNENQESRNLAWGIQDTGPLTNYLLEHGYDGAPANLFANTSGYKDYGNSIKSWGFAYGSNFAGYANYNSNIDYVPKIDKDKQHLMSEFKDKDGKYFVDSGNQLINQKDAKTFSQLNEIKMDKVSRGQIKLVQGDIKNASNLENANDAKEPEVQDLLNSKIKTSSLGELTFNGIGTQLVQTSGTQYIKGQISKVPTFFNSINNTDFGSTMLFKWLDNIYPTVFNPNTDNKTELATRNIVSGIAFGSMESLYSENGLMRDEVKNSATNDLGIDEKIMSEIQKLGSGYHENVRSILDIVGKSVNYNTLFSEQDKQDENIESENKREHAFDITIRFIDQIIKKLRSDISESKKEAFLNKILVSNYKIGSDKIWDTIDYAMTDKLFVNLGLDKGLYDFLKQKVNGNYNLTNILEYSKDIFESINKHNKDIKGLVNEASKIDGHGYLSNLPTNKINEFKSKVGYTKKGFKKGTLLSDSYDLIKKKTTNDSFNELFNLLTSASTSGMHDLHKNIISHIVGDEWKIKNAKINVTSVKDTNGVLKLTLDYNGLGDSTSKADQQFTKVDVPANFNPYQTIKDYFEPEKIKSEGYGEFNGYFDYSKPYNLIDKDKISGKVLGKTIIGKNNQNDIDNFLIDYDGKGNIENLTKKVHHRYNVEWKNVGVENQPYWVISKINCFNVGKNNRLQEFYNIY